MLSIVTTGEKKTLPSAICLEDYISIFRREKKKTKQQQPTKSTPNKCNYLKTKYSAFYNRLTVKLFCIQVIHINCP